MCLLHTLVDLNSKALQPSMAQLRLPMANGGNLGGLNIGAALPWGSYESEGWPP